MSLLLGVLFHSAALYKISLTKSCFFISNTVASRAVIALGCMAFPVLEVNLRLWHIVELKDSEIMQSRSG